MGPVISAGLEGTLGQKCMTQQKKKAEALRQLSCSWLLSGLGCERPSRRKKNNPHCVPRHTGAGLSWSEKHLELFGEAHLWGTFLLPRQEEERGGTFTKKKKKKEEQEVHLVCGI